MADFMRRLGNTGLEVSALGLGTVKLGRNTGVKYPQGFTLPDDSAIKNLFTCAREQDINFLDTAPAYGSSETRIGQLLEKRHDWIIATKTGEEYENGQSRFDFSAAHTRFSIERSLKRLNTDYLDLVLIHSDGNDLDILEHTDCIAALRQCQQTGMVRYIGMSTKTIEGGIKAASLLDVVMLTWNPEQQDTAVLASAREQRKGVLVKKGLMSGHASTGDGNGNGNGNGNGVENSLQCIFSEPGIHSAIVGTLSPEHLAENCALTRKVLDTLPQGASE